MRMVDPSVAPLHDEPGERRLTIVGPEGVPLSFPAASLGERAVAFSIDIVILFATIFFIALVGMFLTAGSGLTFPFGMTLIAIFVVQHGYFVFFETHWQGVTPGKKVMRLRVVSKDGAGLVTDAIIARNLMRDVEVFLPGAVLAAPEQVWGNAPSWMIVPASLWLLLMFAMPALSRERTRIGDLVGGTLVVRLPQAKLLKDQAQRTSLVPGAPQDDVLRFTVQQLDVYGETELETLAGLMRKTDEGKASVHDLRVVALAIAKKIGFSGPLPHSDPRKFLRAFYQQQRSHLEKKLLFGQRKQDKFDG